MSDRVYSFIERWCDENASYIPPTFRTFNDYREHPEYTSGIGQYNWASCKKAITQDLEPKEIEANEEDYEYYFEEYSKELVERR